VGENYFCNAIFKMQKSLPDAKIKKDGIRLLGTIRVKKRMTLRSLTREVG
jgi:hypothetical protein